MDTIKSVIEMEHRASVNNLSLSVFFYGHNHGWISTHPADELFHMHSYIEVFCCVAEEMFVMTEGGPIKLQRSDVLLMPINNQHFAYGVRYALVSLGFIGKRQDVRCDYDLYGEFFDILEIKNVRIYRGAEEVCRRIISMMSAKHGYLSPLPALEFMMLLHELKKNEYDTVCIDSCSSEASNTKKSDITRFLLIEHFVITHYAEPYDKDEVAARLCVTRRHMDRIIKEHYGKTLRELIYERRIMYAKGFLADGAETVEKIAHRLGFSSAAVFKKAFVSLVGVTPSEYRAETQRQKN